MQSEQLFCLTTGMHWAIASWSCGIWTGGWGMKWPQDSPAAWEGTGLPVANSAELSCKDTQCSFRSFRLSFSCQLSVTWLAAWEYLFLFSQTPSLPTLNCTVENAHPSVSYYSRPQVTSYNTYYHSTPHLPPYSAYDFQVGNIAGCFLVSRQG